MSEKLEKLITHFSNADVVIKERKTVFQGFYRVDQFTFDHLRFDGEWQSKVQRELLVRRDAVGVLLFDPITNNIVLIQQFRIGAFGKADNPWLLEIVAGLIDDPQESPEMVACREIKEETGLNVTQLYPMCSYFASPGGSSELLHLYLGICDSHQANGFHGLASEQEDIRVVCLSLDDAITLLTQGKVNNAATIIALLWLKQHQKEVNLWQSC